MSTPNSDYAYFLFLLSFTAVCLMKILAFLLSVPSWLMCIRLYSPSYDIHEFRGADEALYIVSVITGLCGALLAIPAFRDDEHPIVGWLKAMVCIVPSAGIVSMFSSI